MRVININEGHNADIVRQCAALEGYVRFIGKIRQFERQKLSLDEAVTRAINECIRDGILADFLKSHGSEVTNMLTLQYDAETEKRVIREEAREEGREVGREETLQIILALKKNRNPDEIARSLQLPVERVMEWQQILTG